MSVNLRKGISGKLKIKQHIGKKPHLKSKLVRD